jgi:uncharacterized protein YjbI with pentapeptide repeats
MQNQPAQSCQTLTADRHHVSLQTATFKVPPIDRSLKNRCTFKSSAMGQANAARDSLYDLRECDMSGKDAAGFDISGALMAGGDFSKTNFKETQLSKVRRETSQRDTAAVCRNAILMLTLRGSSYARKGLCSQCQV